ncbi:MAG: hypothetical protein MI920_23665 [Kiloniellales bacterium]|nr:hypothetical protein [Kiloniellales bacterium]
MEATKLVFIPAALSLGLALLTGPALAAGSEDPDWPCVQRQVPEISAGMVWAGPPVDEAKGAGQATPEIRELAKVIAARATDMEDARTRIAAFAEGRGADRNAQLTRLFGTTLALVNRERNEVIAGIKRYARRQASLAKKIEAMTADFNRLPIDGGEESERRREELQEQLNWDTRIFDERQQSLVYVCETPVLLEQRVFAISREIMNQLD